MLNLFDSRTQSPQGLCSSPPTKTPADAGLFFGGGHIPKYIEPPKRLPFSLLALLSNKP
jgi:hypothetical protein